MTYSGFIEKLDRDADSGRHVVGSELSTSRIIASVVFVGDLKRQQCGKDAMAIAYTTSHESFVRAYCF